MVMVISQFQAEMVEMVVMVITPFQEEMVEMVVITPFQEEMVEMVEMEVMVMVMVVYPCQVLRFFNIIFSQEWTLCVMFFYLSIMFLDATFYVYASPFRKLNHNTII